MKNEKPEPEPESVEATNDVTIEVSRMTAQFLLDMIGQVTISANDPNLLQTAACITQIRNAATAALAS